MIIVLLIACIVLSILGFLWDIEPAQLIGVFGGVASIIAVLIIFNNIISLRPIDSQIAMHETENLQIEEQIFVAIENYQAHEKQIFESVSPDSAITLISLYPELKTDKLIEIQIETYIENNNRIRELKSKKLNESVYRWWLYFGK